MTSLSETYLSCKSAMATKLNNKGITAASADDGLTTLINYIDDIAPSANGLLLSADRSIGQSSDTVNFTALYVADGNVVSGKSVNFYGLKSATSTSKSLTANTWTPVGCKFGVSVDSSVAGMLALTKDSTPVSIIAAEGVLIVNIPNKSPYSNVSNIVFEEGVLSFTYNGNTVTEDLSSYDCTNVNASVSGFTIADYGVFDTTDSNGVATAQYTCSGKGKFNVTAISGSVVSEPYNVYDCFITDSGVTGTYNEYNIDTDVTVDSDHSTGTLLTNNKESGNARRIFNNNNVGSDGMDITSAFCLEFEIVSFSGRTNFNFYQTSPYSNISDVFNTNNSAITTATLPCKIKIVHDGEKYTCYVDDVEVTGLINKPHEWNTGLFAFMITAGSSIKYRNFKVYPI